MQARGKQTDYLKRGAEHATIFRRVIERIDPAFLTGKRVMDFGCGHGRMTRHMEHVFAPSPLAAADVLPTGPAFCAQEFGAVPFLISDDNPISKYPGRLDVIVCLSVFSHLPRRLFGDSMAGLSAILDSNGLLVFTACGDAHERRWRINRGPDGFWFGSIAPKAAEQRRRHINLSRDRYANTCVSRGFVEALLQRVGLKLVDHIPEGFSPEQKRGGQDIYVARAMEKAV